MRHAARRLAPAIATFLFCASASATVIGTNSRYALVDGSEATRQLRVNARGIISDLNIYLEFSKCDDPPIGADGSRCIGRGIPYEDEFSFALIAPDGRRVDLVRAYGTYNETGRAAAPAALA
ncbi:hypothetical protein G4G28_18065 [Massilia sp. Dwa41.01b]|uniref:hypothetical protein n=1 Tax=Massilia sp. Dwa41.01b TaxID=2709302 RepID=UPI001603A964|nr:hypothetical protein [Massilia sp. Dwa41.01b]QNA89923.1 hypothetical protein G4G28_18065 [Massilia sp. Dwa41.01b]